MSKTLTYSILALALLVGGFFAFNSYIYQAKQGDGGFQRSYKDTAYTIDGHAVELVNGISEVDAAPNSSSKITTKYFGNEAEGDLNGDGVSDIAFLLTQTTGGSGIFYYVVVGLKTDTGYVGTNGVLLGDRIAPQTTEIRNGELVVNFAERKPGEPMTARPSVGVSKYLKVEGGMLRESEHGVICTADAMQCPDGSWVGRSGPNCKFVCPTAGSESGIRGNVTLGPTCPVERIPPDPNCADKPYQSTFTLTNPDGSGIIKTFTSDKNGIFNVQAPPGQYGIRSASANVLPRCSSAETIIVKANMYTQATIFCDTGIR